MLDSEFSEERQGAFQGTGRRYRGARIKPLSPEQREQLQGQQQLYLLERMGLELLLLKVPSARGAEYIHQECSLRTGILLGKKAQESRDSREAPDANSYYCLFCEKNY